MRAFDLMSAKPVTAFGKLTVMFLGFMVCFGKRGLELQCFILGKRNLGLNSGKKQAEGQKTVVRRF